MLKYAGSKVPILVRELHELAMGKHILTYTPVHGLVIDPFAWMLSLACPAMKMARSTIVFEKDGVCFWEAMSCLYLHSDLLVQYTNHQNFWSESYHDAVAAMRVKILK